MEIVPGITLEVGGTEDAIRGSFFIQEFTMKFYCLRLYFAVQQSERTVSERSSPS